MVRKWTLWFWVLLQLSLLGISLYFIIVRGFEAGITILLWLEFVVTFPSGYIPPLLHYGAYLIFGPIKIDLPYGDLLYFVFMFLLYNLLGYLQWFVVVPKIFRWIAGIFRGLGRNG